MKKIIVLAGLCLALLVPACKGQDQAIAEQTAPVQETAAPAARPAPVVPAPIVAVTDPMIADAARKARIANGDTEREARAIQVGETRKDVCGLPTVTFQKGDTYWSICKAALRDPVATELAAAEVTRSELAREVDRLSDEKVALQRKWTQSYARWETSNTLVEGLQARIDARPAAAPAAAAAAAAPPATGQPQTKRN